MKRLLAVILSVVMLVLPVSVLAEASDYATRGEVCQMLLSASDDYKPNLSKSDILKGDGSGDLKEDKPVTRAEALIMISRAFPEFPELKGYNAYLAIPKDSFSDIPDWAAPEINRIFDAGLVAGKAEGVFAPDDYVTKDEINLWIQRIYALFGSNIKDNFYTFVNRDALSELKIADGQISAGTFSDMSDKTEKELLSLIKDAAMSDAAPDTPEGKVKILYNNLMDKASQDKDGMSPLIPYLEKLEKVESMDDLEDFLCYIYNDLGTLCLFDFSLGTDYVDSDSYVLYFSSLSHPLPKEAYNGEADYMKNAFLTYLKTLSALSGSSDASAEKEAQVVWNIGSELSDVSLTPEDYYDSQKTYNVFTLSEIDSVFKSIDMQKIFKATGFKNKDKIIVEDKGLIEKSAELLAEDNLENIKTYIKIALLSHYSSCFGSDFAKASDLLYEQLYGASGSESDEITAARNVSDALYTCVDKMYKNTYYSEETVKKVTELTKEIINAYKEKIQKLDWMTAETKNKAILKLDTMNIKIGAESGEYIDYHASADLKSYEDGGSLFQNYTQLKKSEREALNNLEGTKVDKSEWQCTSYTVNAFYNPGANDITIPMAFLQEPIYSENYSYEELLGGIGFVIGHEISHAFDTSGSQYDENGNVSDWWTEEDKATFNILCEKVIKFYDGREIAPGIVENGTLTLIENIADLGSISCISAIGDSKKDFDYKKMYETLAKCWVDLCTREAIKAISLSDIHSLLALRVNPPLQSVDKFYEVYDITEGDGMWIAPEDRARIW